jgi:hypothetical protein
MTVSMAAMRITDKINNELETSQVFETCEVFLKNNTNYFNIEN